jgi:hypothetical protein
MKMNRRVVAAVAAMVLGVTGVVSAYSEAPPAISLKGLRIVWLSCVNLSGWDEIDEALAVIRPQVETKLRNNGFRLLSEDEWLATPSAPRLEISVRTAKSRGSLEALELSAGPDPEIRGTRTAFVFYVGMRLTQEVQLASNARVKFAASTWSWEGWLGAEQQRPFKAIRADVLRGVDAFIDDWKRAQKEP